ncbi:hypothetical protein [Virgibacillus pantothenticus]|nr:hypothetical protein [Virgibacillus pantothenticus]QTY16926.1 hypothetical protein KBP50_03110 [Virgibacillus pantothenticus]SIT17135.1 hypothetical protein SAMN05421787_12827 [Virgibacillus pantothenticus]
MNIVYRINEERNRIIRELALKNIEKDNDDTPTEELPLLKLKILNGEMT